MPEWSNGVVSKTIVRVSVPRVRIPVSPPFTLFFGIIVTDNFFIFFVKPRVTRLNTCVIQTSHKVSVPVILRCRSLTSMRAGNRVYWLSASIDYPIAGWDALTGNWRPVLPSIVGMVVINIANTNVSNTLGG